MLTISDIRSMTREEINENWDEVRQALARARDPMTKEEIAAIKDHSARLKAIQENMHLFSEETRYKG